MKSMLICCAVLLSLFSAPSIHAEEEPFDITQLNCWDLGLLDEQEAAYTLLLVYGYHVGTQSQNLISGQAIQSTLEQVAKQCEAEPDTLILDIIK